MSTQSNIPTLTEKIKEIVYHDSDVDKLLSLIQSTVKGCIPEKHEHPTRYAWNEAIDTITKNLKKVGLI